MIKVQRTTVLMALVRLQVRAKPLPFKYAVDRFSNGFVANRRSRVMHSVMEFNSRLFLSKYEYKKIMQPKLYIIDLSIS